MNWEEYLSLEQEVIKYLFDNEILRRKKWYTNQENITKENNINNDSKFRDDLVSRDFKKIIDLESCLQHWTSWKEYNNYSHLNKISVNFYKYFDNLYEYDVDELKRCYLGHLEVEKIITKSLKLKLENEINLLNEKKHYIKTNYAFIHQLFQQLFKFDTKETILKKKNIYLCLYRRYQSFLDKKNIILNKYILAHYSNFDNKNILLYKLNFSELSKINDSQIRFVNSKIRNWEKMVYIDIRYDKKSKRYIYLNKEKLKLLKFYQEYNITNFVKMD